MPTPCVAQKVAVDELKRERIWRLLQAVFPREEHMLATNKKCGRRGPILVLDSGFGGAAHGTVRWIMKE